MLTDTDLEARDRVAGAFVMLYGQTAARITPLTGADFTVDPDAVRLRLGRDLLDLPPPLDDTSPAGSDSSGSNQRCRADGSTLNEPDRCTPSPNARRTSRR